MQTTTRNAESEGILDPACLKPPFLLTRERHQQCACFGVVIFSVVLACLLLIIVLILLFRGNFGSGLAWLIGGGLLLSGVYYGLRFLVEGVAGREWDRYQEEFRQLKSLNKTDEEAYGELLRTYRARQLARTPMHASFPLRGSSAPFISVNL